MSQPIKLCDEIVLDARIASEIAERTVAGQIEHWAKLGRAVEPFLQGPLPRAGAVEPLSECLKSVDSPTAGAEWPRTLTASRFPIMNRPPAAPVCWSASRRMARAQLADSSIGSSGGGPIDVAMASGRHRESRGYALLLAHNSWRA